MIVTLAAPPGIADNNITDTAPVWTDAGGVEYRVTSGILDGEYTATEPVTAAPDRLNVVIGMDGLDALAAMGLSAPVE